MNKFKTGDKVYLHKRGIFANECRDYTLVDLECIGSPMLVKNTVYTIKENSSNTRIRLEGHILTYHEDHFIKYEQI